MAYQLGIIARMATITQNPYDGTESIDHIEDVKREKLHDNIKLRYT
jgi:hypothetical protein